MWKVLRIRGAFHLLAKYQRSQRSKGKERSGLHNGVIGILLDLWQEDEGATATTTHQVVDLACFSTCIQPSPEQAEIGLEAGRVLYKRNHGVSDWYVPRGWLRMGWGVGGTLKFGDR